MPSFAKIAFWSLILPGFATAAAEKPLGLPKTSPFMPAAGSAPAAPVTDGNIEFEGVSSLGKRTDLIFYDKSAKKSYWIAKGETKEGISVLNYDERREQVVVKINGSEKTLALRKATPAANTPRPVTPMPIGFNVAPQVQTLPAAVNVAPPTPPTAPTTMMALPAPAPTPDPTATPAKPEGPVTPEMRSKQETEARMLVSDLLEIGMAQRKAYEEAQRRAAQGNTQPATNAAATNPAGADPAATTPPATSTP